MAISKNDFEHLPRDRKITLRVNGELLDGCENIILSADYENVRTVSDLIEYLLKQFRAAATPES